VPKAKSRKLPSEVATRWNNELIPQVKARWNTEAIPQAKADFTGQGNLPSEVANHRLHGPRKVESVTMD
jgi:hypothetical protein